jgi:hypothetical protein
MKEIPLTQGKVALVDDEDYEHLSQFKWHAMRDRRKWVDDVWYARRTVKDAVTGKERVIQMQKEIMRPPPGLFVAFRNHDGLDNRRDNLVITTKAKSNAQRRLRQRDLPRGVRRINKTGKFGARISAASTHLGVFDTPEAASAAYQAARREYGFDAE